jgi:hypothetical protein
VDAEDAKQGICDIFLQRRDTRRYPLEFLSGIPHPWMKGNKSLCVYARRISQLPHDRNRDTASNPSDKRGRFSEPGILESSNLGYSKRSWLMHQIWMKVGHPTGIQW